MLSSVLIALPATYLLLLLGWHLVRRHLLAKSQGIQDFPLLRNARHSDGKIQGTAVICGGSIAGLLAARVCHNHFARVLVVEPEAWVASHEGRKIDGWDCTRQRARVMQYTSLHACQSFLYAGLQYLFPNIEEECRRSRILVSLANHRYTLTGVLFRVPFHAFKSALPKTMYLTRSGFETLLRRLVLNPGSYPNIEYLTGTVTGVNPDPENHSRLSKVIVRVESGVQEFEAALVADCTGPTRAGMKWLERNGYGYSTTYPRGKLPLDKLKISFDQKLRYSSMTFRYTPEFHDRLPLPAELRDTKPIYSFLEDVTKESLSKGRAFFVLLRTDGDQLVAFTGHYGMVRQRPENLAELKEYVQGLLGVQAIPDWVWAILDLLEEVEDSIVVALVSVPPTTYIRYHLAMNLPSNWVALGDSAMTVNPLFAEGCSKAFRGALALHKLLHSARVTNGNTLPSNFSSKYFAEMFDKTDWIWERTRLMDYGVPTTEPLSGEALSSGSYLRWYITWLQRLATTDDQAGLVFYNSSSGLGSSIDALHPALVLKVLWLAGRRSIFTSKS
ncbi:hypothetical protein C8R46DRAFT_1213157 [Mycena filopes]|nr:hypothetical protein C8R46DRAFT_1213157 [Mycena filopes]